jgi:hypothetical protein
MSRTREQLINEFRALDAELLELEANGEAEEVLWLAFERMAQVPVHVISQRDRLWWWGQLYATMDRHSLRSFRATVSQVDSPGPTAQHLEGRRSHLR